jgi:hypothetical protein
VILTIDPKSVTVTTWEEVGWTTPLSKLTRVVSLLFLFCCVAQAAQSNSPQKASPSPMVIKGLEQPGAAGSFKLLNTDIQLTTNQLTMRVPSLAEPVTVQPWHRQWGAQLQQSISQHLSAGNPAHSAKLFRKLQPFGIAQSITVSREDSVLPWLGMQTNAMSGQKVLADWSLLYTQGRWMLKQSGQDSDVGAATPNLMTLNMARPNTLQLSSEVWCFYVVDKPQRIDVPALLDWVLVQQRDAKKDCPSLDKP